MNSPLPCHFYYLLLAFGALIGTLFFDASRFLSATFSRTDQR
ncbi:hypothetical protein ACTHR6_20505 [Ralstonia holmesii]|nr:MULTISPECIES: hypothetical protein [Ralstonia]